MALITDPEAARRLARTIASDLSLYFEEKIVKGIQGDNFFEVMNKEIEEGREHYKNRVSPEILSKTNFFERAIVDIILRSKACIKSKIW